MADENNNQNQQQYNMPPQYNQQQYAQPPQKPKKPIYKKWWFWLIIVFVLIIIISAVSGGGSDNETDTSQNNTSASDSSDVVAEGEEKENNTIGDFKCVVKKAVLCKDYAGEDAVLIAYDFTNNSSESISFDLALVDEVYQDGVELEIAITDDDTESFDTKIKPGVTKEVTKAYLLSDTTTDLDIEISELISFSDDKIVTQVKLQK